LEWLEVSVVTDGEAAEAVVELFNRYGRGQSVVETPVDLFEYELPAASYAQPVIVKAYLPADAAGDAARVRLEEGLWHLSRLYPIPEPSVRRLAEKDWAEAWKEQYHLQRVGNRIVIVPAWEQYQCSGDEVVIRLEPGMAFGTGLHPTTRLCLRALEKHLAAGSRVLDVGTGSGILAIAAARLGAGQVLALEADRSAVLVARENVAMNGVSGQVDVRHGTLPGGMSVPVHFAAGQGLELLQTGQFDLVMINILAPVILSVAPALAARLGSTGRLIVSGLIESQEHDIMNALRARGLQALERYQEKDWVALVAERGGGSPHSGSSIVHIGEG
jgi:ribosomal protein L11 methyltransferase